jgi:hypothetical protein
MFSAHEEHPCWAEGYNDGLEDRKANPPLEDETLWHEYMEGYYIGQDAALGEVDPLTPDERKEVYGDDRGGA